MAKQTNGTPTVSLRSSVVTEPVMASDSRRRVPPAEPKPDETAAAQRGRAAIERGAFIALDDLQCEMGYCR